MSYAVRKDGQGWRAINCIDDCGIDEDYSETQPLPIEVDIKIQRKAEILAELSSLDAKSIRPIREGDTKRLADLDKQAQALRDELKSL